MLPKRILAAHDFSTVADRALSFAADFARGIGAKLDVVHVHPDVYDGHSDPTLGLPWPMPDQLERYLRFLDSELERAVVSVLGEDASQVERHILRGEPVKRVLGLAQEIGADVLCIGSTGKGAVERALLGSISQRILRLSPVSVLTVH